MNAMDMHRKAIESKYRGVCSIYEYQSVKNDITKVTSKEEVLILEDQPCKLSYSREASTNNSTGAAQQSVATKLFISPDIVIKPGSKIVVTQDGKTIAFQDSGVPGLFQSHQEIVLNLFERWA